MTTQTVGGSRRRQILDGIVAYLLQEGLVGLTLRPLARALGTSDRMLLYYFDTRDQLLEAALAEIGFRLQRWFEAQIPAGGVTPPAMVEAAARGMRDPTVRSQLQVWIEVVALAARGDIACKRIVGAVTTQWSEWVSRQLQIPETDKTQAAAAVLAVVDGLVLLQLSGRDDLARDAEQFLQSAWAPEGPH